MKNSKKKKGIRVGLWVRLGFCIIFAAFIVVIALRTKLFPGDSVIYNMYDPDFEPNGTERVLIGLLKTGMIFSICFLIFQVSHGCVRLSDMIKNNSAKTTLLLLGNLFKYAAAIAFVLVTLGAWGVDTAAIVTGSAVIALVIGLGCQSLIADIVAGIFMLFEGDIKVGDIVVIDGWRGEVKQIGLRRTKIEDAVGNVNIVNNSAISNIINNTQDLSVAVVEVGTEYNESILRIEEVIEEGLPVMKEHIPAIVEGPFYKGVQSLGESSVNIKLVAKCKEEDKYQVERDLNREIKLLFDANKINVPFNQIVLNTRDPKEPDKTQYKPKKASTKNFAQEQGELSKDIEEQIK
ncbi:MAG: mechanosensitive ion channel family protein [Bacilli bacterium]|nr:mechanosensitive ion channel family protein [Bacilli bacterium]